MTKIMCKKMTILQAAALLAVLLFMPGMVAAQEEVASAIRRYKDREVSSGYYDEYEVLSRSHRIPVRGGQRIFPYSPSAANVRIRSRLSDAHAGIKFYSNRRCEDCHIRQAKNIHTVRGNLTCRQCHGSEPIASIDHYRSPMNPIRRHAYVCAKCHEGASASFSTYVVHAPNPAMLSTKSSFPALFYAFWIMVAVAVGTFVVFLPHTVMWGIRELFQKGEKR